MAVVEARSILAEVGEGLCDRIQTPREKRDCKISRLRPFRGCIAVECNKHTAPALGWSAANRNLRRRHERDFIERLTSSRRHPASDNLAVDQWKQWLRLRTEMA